jgi:hypothetical protein
MFTRHNVHFTLMVLTTAIAAATALNFMIGVGARPRVSGVRDLYLPLSMLCLPFGAALWVAPDHKTALEGGSAGLITGLTFVAYMILVDRSPTGAVLYEQFIRQGYIIGYGYVVFAFVILATLSGFASGWAMVALGEARERARHKARAEQLKRR